MTTLTTSRYEPSAPPEERRKRPGPEIAQSEVGARVDEILSRHPAVGLALGVVRNGGLEFFMVTASPTS